MQHLSSDECGLKDLVVTHGQPSFYKDDSKDGSSMSNFQSLAKAIVYQQLAGAAASTIWNRLLTLAAEEQVSVYAPADTVCMCSPSPTQKKARVKRACILQPPVLRYCLH